MDLIRFSLLLRSSRSSKLYHIFYKGGEGRGFALLFTRPNKLEKYTCDLNELRLVKCTFCLEIFCEVKEK